MAKKEPAPKISVIVPVYKVEKYLPECIESVLAQTFMDFELILVDDGSPDNSGAICDAYVARDPRIRVFHKENGGVTSARRLGVERSRGEWITFVDSDDKLFPNALRDLATAADAHPDADLVEAAMSREESANQSPSTEPGSQSVLCVTGLEYAVATASHKMIWIPGPVAKIIRKSVLVSANALDVPAWINFGEDLMMCIRLARNVRKAVRVPSMVYFYRPNPNGACATIRRSAKYYADWLHECERALPGGVSGAWRGVWTGVARCYFMTSFWSCADWDSFDGFSRRLVKELSSEKDFPLATRVSLSLARIPSSRVQALLKTIIRLFRKA
ncbi:MAG: glycosyltransferase family 2 protein [Candidatus Spyradosoma sp.]